MSKNNTLRLRKCIDRSCGAHQVRNAHFEAMTVLARLRMDGTRPAISLIENLVQLDIGKCLINSY